MCCESVHLPFLKFLENFTFVALGIVVIVVSVVGMIVLPIVLNSGSTTSISSINLLPFGQ